MLEAEVNLDFCRREGIEVYRRKSGGGAVLADMNNIMFSYVTASPSEVPVTFSAYTSMVARSLRALGLDASDNSRNDILISGRKVSGNSYYHMPGRSIVHGTMLYDCDGDMMASALTPATAKLRSHGVASVRSRITTIREHLPSLSLPAFKEHVLATIPDGDIETLTPAEIAEVEMMERSYHDPAWTGGHSPAGTVAHTARIDGVGTLTAHLTVKGGVVAGFDLTGDYLETAPASQVIAAALEGCAYSRDALSACLAELPSLCIPGLESEDLVNLIY